VRREEEIRNRLALCEASLADGFLEVRESKLNLNYEPHEVFVVPIEARRETSLKGNLMWESKPDLRNYRTAALVNVIFELGAESEELRHVITSAGSELNARRTPIDRHFLGNIKCDIHLGEILREDQARFDSVLIMTVFEAAHVHFTGKCNVNRPVALLPEAVTHFEPPGIEIRISVFGMIDRYPTVDHQVMGETVLHCEVVPLEICVAFPIMAVIEPIFRFHRSFFDCLKDESFVDVIRAMSEGRSTKAQDKQSDHQALSTEMPRVDRARKLTWPGDGHS